MHLTQLLINLAHLGLLLCAAVVCLVKAPGRAGRLGAAGFGLLAVPSLIWMLFSWLTPRLGSFQSAWTLTALVALVVFALGIGLVLVAVIADRGAFPRYAAPAAPAPMPGFQPGPDA